MKSKPKYHIILSFNHEGEKKTYTVEEALSLTDAIEKTSKLYPGANNFHVDSQTGGNL